jgi:DNA-binding response OmpR family regulator/anti-sigma regulatory factor (Ser/Thr protein kinase)
MRGNEDNMEQKILVIEDEEPLRKDVMEMLRFEGFDVMGAPNGADGLQLARHYLPDVIVCDIMMPGDYKGFDVLAELRKDRITALIPFIFLTARIDRMDQRHGMELGADDYLTKPFKISELLGAIKVRLQKRSELIAMSEEKLETLRENITTSLPHELRTPLNTIIGFSDMMVADARTIQPDQIAEWSQLIHSAGMRLYRLIENYLTFARVETMRANNGSANTLRNKYAKHPASTVEFEAMAKAQQHHRDNDLVLNVADTEQVRIAEEDMKKVISELVDNAFKFSEGGTSVQVEAFVEEQCYVVRIIDQGRGMTPLQMKSIGAYMQFDRWLYEQQGMGLGLTIAQRLIEIYGGTLKLESAPNEGAVVTVSFALN